MKSTVMKYQVTKPRIPYSIIERQMVGGERFKHGLEAISFLFETHAFTTETREATIEIGKLNTLSFNDANYRKIDVKNLQRNLESTVFFEKFFILDDFLRFMNPFQTIASGIATIINMGDVKLSREKASVKKELITNTLSQKSINGAESLGKFSADKIYKMSFEIAAQLHFDCLISLMRIDETQFFQSEFKCESTVIQVNFDN